jgi:hypothetical protein
MKTILTLLITLSSFVFFGSVQGQTTYKITSNSNWSAKLPSTCADCNIIISTGVTLTMDGSFTCQNCSFQGGTVSMTSKTLNIQYTGGSPVTTSFDGTNFQVYGTGSIVVNAPLSLTNAVFTFNNTSSIQTSFQVDLSGSTIDLYDNTSMVSTGGSSTDLTLSKSSKIVIGNGSQTSGASLFVNGPTVDIYKNSAIELGNTNNAYINWANYTTYNNNGNGGGGAASYSTANSTINCGSGYPHACAGSYVYGPASLSTAGTVPVNLLPVVLADFTARWNNDQTITDSWNTQQEVNFSHFEIERSQNGSTWNTIGSVPAKGNSSIETNYSFTDRSPLAGVNYYRLKIVDLDGHYDYSEIKVQRSALITKTSFFPNPAHDYVNVALGETAGVSVTVRLINQAGQVLQEKKGITGNGAAISIPLQQYAAGLYILSVSTADGACESSKLLISRS